MIRRLQLRNWKSYADLDVEFSAGCNFLVAENGVGKTGLIQAIYFALFGDGALLGSRSPVLVAVRRAEPTAEVELTVDFGAEHWTVRREIQRSAGVVVSSFEAGGSERSEEDWLGRLSAESLVDPVQLRLLCAIPEGSSSPAELDAADRYDLAAHLSSVLGATKLTDLAKHFAARSATIVKEADSIRLTERDRPQKASSQRLETLREELMAARAQAATAEAVLEWREWDEWTERTQERALVALAKWTAPLAEAAGLLAEVPPMVDGPQRRPGAASGELEGLLRSHSEARGFAAETVGRLRQLYGDRARELAQYEAEVDACRASIELLSREGAICPTCLRPMSDTERAEAIQRNQERIVEIQPAVDDVRATQARLVELGQLVASIGAEPEIEVRSAPTVSRPPTEPASTGSPSDISVEAARAELAQREALVGKLQADVAAIEGARRMLAENDALSKRLRGMYRASDIYAVTAATFEQIAETMCAGRIEPLATELAKRWNDVWPDRPKIRLDSRGALTADAEGAQLSLVDLSGGERAVAMVLLRILAAQAASRCPFLLLDEPLEHLDPTNRRMLANLLSAAGRAGTHGTRQLIVTTYEETVARRLGISEWTDVVYVRSG